MDRRRPPVLDRRAFLASGAGVVALVTGTGQISGPTGDDRSVRNGQTGGDTDVESGSRQRDGTDRSPHGASVFVNQVGYRPDDAKLAIVRADASAFAVVDAATGDAVTGGTLSPERSDASSGDLVRWADFSEVTTPGRYRLVTADGRASSVAFNVGSEVWTDTLRDLCRQYTLRRSGTQITDPRTGLDIDPGHPQDSEATLYAGDGFHGEGETLDVSGGWYDAGDYGKYVPTAAVTVAQLLLAAEFAPDVVSTLDLQVPDGVSRTELPDLLAEVKFELEWLERMQRPDGAVYHKVAGTDWPGTVPPAADTQQRYVFGLSTYGTGLYAGAMAMAGRVFAEYDPSFAARTVRNARSAFEFLSSTEDPIFRHEEGQDAGSGAYRKETDAEERFWAAAELGRTTGDAKFSTFIEQEHADQLTAPPTPIAWNDARTLGQWAYYRTTDADADRREAVGETIVNRADEILTAVDADGYRVSLRPDEYVWGSTRRAIAKGNLLLFANEIDPDRRFRAGAIDQIHYALGRAPTGTSYVTGSGERSPDDIHCRLTNSTGVNIPGHVVGGPNANAADPALSEYVESRDPAPAKCYLDASGSYASNEPAIDYAAPLVFAIAAVS